MLCASGRQPRSQGRRLPAEDEMVYCVSSPVGAIQRSILDGLAEMSWLYAYSAVQVRDRARYLQDTVVCPCGKPQPRNRVFQQLLALGCNRAVLADHLRHHLRVRIGLFLAVKSFELSISRGDHALPDGSRILRRRWRSQFLVFHRGNLDVNINAIQQWPRNLRNVAL